jgi:penicillin-insensitive murein DD-endopeptidase
MQGVLAAVLVAGILVAPDANAAESVCYGTPSNGSLEGGVALAESGPNFTPYSSLGVSLGRTYVHSRVAAVVSSAYKALETSAPGKVYVYGESGWKGGGRFKPHRTHQNGTAVDFMVPVVDRDGKSVPLPTGVTDKFGYSLEFNKEAKYRDLSIDFEAVAEHLYALHQAAKAEGISISRAIFEKAYIPRLYETKRGAYIRSSVTFMQGEPWIRHDEHYHVDFAVPCKPKAG